MRIAQIASLASPVRRVGSDSIESIVWLLARELTARGHEVTTFACAGSDVDGELVVTLPGPYARNGSPGDWRLCEWMNVCAAVSQAERFDVLHSHNYLWAMPLAEICPKPILHTLHVSPYDDAAFVWSRHADQPVTAISRFQWSRYPQFEPVAIIPLAVDEAQFTFRAQPDDYLLYLGRFTEGKGPLEAIRTAQRLGQRLLLAGPRNDYFTELVEPQVDGDLVQYVGAVHGSRRDQLFGGARALLYPVQSPEPFGLVLVEAMLCGTPVAAVSIGAVPEVVDDGVTGCCCAGSAELPRAIARASELPRAAVRERALQRFSPSRMAEQYLEVYERLLAEPAGKRGGAG